MTIAAADQKQILATLQAVGYDVTFRRPANSSRSYDPATSSLSGGGGNQNETVRGIFLNYRNGAIDGSLIERGDRLFAMSASYNGAALSKTPQRGDQIIGEGDPVTVIDVQIVKGNATVIGYLLQVRK